MKFHFLTKEFNPVETKEIWTKCNYLEFPKSGLFCFIVLLLEPRRLYSYYKTSTAMSFYLKSTIFYHRPAFAITTACSNIFIIQLEFRIHHPLWAFLPKNWFEFFFENPEKNSKIFRKNCCNETFQLMIPDLQKRSTNNY